MNKNIKYIRIGLENVEIIDLGIKDVIYLKHDKLTKNTVIKISKSASKKTYSCYNQKPGNIFTRLTKYNDICDISYLDKDKKIIEEIIMPWDERHEDFNSLQSYKYENGNLVISISSNKNHFLELDINKNDFEKKQKDIYAKQRIAKGFCDYDLWDIDEWFLEIIPNMLKELISKHSGFPNCIIHEYYIDNKEKYSRMLHDVSIKDDIDEAKHFCKSEEDIICYLFEVYSKENQVRLAGFRKEFEDGCIKKWQSILNKMIELFSKARGAGYDRKKDKIKAAEEGLDLFKKYLFCLFS